MTALLAVVDFQICGASMRIMSLALFLCILATPSAAEDCDSVLKAGTFDIREGTDKATALRILRQHMDRYNAATSSRNSSAGASYAGFGVSYGQDAQDMASAFESKSTEQVNLKDSDFHERVQTASKAVLDAWTQCSAGRLGLLIRVSRQSESVSHIVFKYRSSRAGDGSSVNVTLLPSVGLDCGRVLAFAMKTDSEQAITCTGGESDRSVTVRTDAVIAFGGAVVNLGAPSPESWLFDSHATSTSHGVTVKARLEVTAGFRLFVHVTTESIDKTLRMAPWVNFSLGPEGNHFTSNNWWVPAMVGAQRTETFDVTALLNSKGVPLNEIVGLAKDGKLAFTIIVPK